MAALPASTIDYIGGKKVADNTVAAIYRHYEENSDSGFRAHLGASIIGKECERELYYDFHWTTVASFEGRMLRLFETGQLEEERLVANLRAIGCIVHEVDEGTGRQFKISAVGGHYGGSLDGIAIGVPEAPKTWHVCEFKTHNDKSFTDLAGAQDKKTKVRSGGKGVRLSKPLHYAQMQSYMFHMGYERALYLAKNKDTEELYAERVDLNKAFAETLLKKAERIITSNRPLARMSNDPSFFYCKHFCDHSAVCHGEKFPEVNCRTCIFSTAEQSGGWHCAKHNLFLSTEQQKKGCQSHRYNPTMINMKQTDAAEDGSWIEYTKEDGSKFRDVDKS